MVTILFMLQGIPENQFGLYIDRSLAESIKCPDKLHLPVIRLHTFCLKTCHLFLFFSSSSEAFQTEVPNGKIEVFKPFEGRENLQGDFFLVCFLHLIWIWHIGPMGAKWKTGVRQKPRNFLALELYAHVGT